MGAVDVVMDVIVGDVVVVDVVADVVVEAVMDSFRGCCCLNPDGECCM